MSFSMSSIVSVLIRFNTISYAENVLLRKDGFSILFLKVNNVCPMEVSREGHSHWKVVGGCAAVITSFFQDSRRSLAYQITTNAPLMCPNFHFFKKNFAFSAFFWPKFQFLRRKFSKFSFPRLGPHFSRI